MVTFSALSDRFVVALALAFGLFVSGCATTPNASEKSWTAKPLSDQTTQVVFIGGEKPVIARTNSAYRDYREIPRSQYEKYHLPAEAASAFAGRDRVDHDVVYAVDSGKQWKIYGFTFGLYDIDLPATLLGSTAK